VLQPVAQKGLNPSEVTMAEVMKSAGYVTMCIGKWHLGDQPGFLPTKQGFDEFFGIPYSDDMTKDKKPDIWPELPLMRGEKVIEAPADRDHLVKRCTEEAVRFIEAHQSGAVLPLFAAHNAGIDAASVFEREFSRQERQRRVRRLRWRNWTGAPVRSWPR
jgi:arylsulfatase A